MTLSEGLASLGPPPAASERTDPSPWEGVLRSGTPVLVPVDETTLPVLAPELASAQWLEASDTRSLALVPLVIAGTLTGVMLLLATGDRLAFRDEDLPFLEDVAARAGSAISPVVRPIFAAVRMLSS
jgi:GAF domain-containing protein